jgi:hypothetical protein
MGKAAELSCRVGRHSDLCRSRTINLRAHKRRFNHNLFTQICVSYSLKTYAYRCGRENMRLSIALKDTKERL